MRHESTNQHEEHQRELPRIAIVYCSQTGHTKRYAEWIAQDLEPEARVHIVPVSQVSVFDAAKFDLVIFCSWFHAAGLTRASWLKKQLEQHPIEKFAVLSVGATPMPCDEWPESEHEQAFRNSFPEDLYPSLVHFYAQGGFNFKKLGAFDKVAMKIYFRMLKKSGEENSRDKEALSSMREGFDGTNKAYLAPLLSYVRENQLPQPSRVN